MLYRPIFEFVAFLGKLIQCCCPIKTGSAIKGRGLLNNIGFKRMNVIELAQLASNRSFAAGSILQHVGQINLDNLRRIES